MRIAQIAPLYESVPPQKYGGTERIVSYLTEDLVALGHEVTLFASGDSVSKAEIISPCEKSLRLHSGYEHHHIPHFLMFEELRRRMSNFDILHFHTEHLHFPLIRSLSTPTVTTLHGRLDVPALVPLFQEYNEVPLVSISQSQRAPIPGAHWRATIHHGLPENLYRFNPKPDEYAAFLGRMSLQKRPDRAIEIAKRADVPLKLAAKVDPLEGDYYATHIKPLIDSHANVEFIGEINDSEKNEFLGNASVLLFPIDWPEPFGLVMIEAMACGTPVISFRQGAAPEVITEGVTGFLVDSIEEAVEKMKLIPSFDRLKCHEAFRQRFSTTQMVKSYLSVYEELIDGRHSATQQSNLHKSIFHVGRPAAAGFEA